MAEPFLSEIRIVSFNFAPKGWAQTDGQLLQIGQNQALFSLLGTTYGGDGQRTFALPDYRSRVPIHAGSSHTLGERGGESSHTLSINELPTHNHLVRVLDTGDSSSNTNNPTDCFFSNSKPANLYQNTMSNLAPLGPLTIQGVGGSQAHQNMQPYLTLNFCIALSGIFPSQN